MDIKLGRKLTENEIISLTITLFILIILPVSVALVQSRTYYRSSATYQLPPRPPKTTPTPSPTPTPTFFPRSPQP